ncbi:hypothetical protein HK099_004674 [Clydaea vesicula]|uniref:C2H2-type domain-containing protein n=1 Tax=Clydaea vesicula TaxID=447962 RepID=A0AAD5U0D6_9FUNG|nr:hypothetical protein HK099_004674 [Clydaea vesicula]KAJ3390310.1 hypothetical protein HDU92_000549 [Lobulomyces angularis]
MNIQTPFLNSNQIILFVSLFTSIQVTLPIAKLNNCDNINPFRNSMESLHDEIALINLLYTEIKDSVEKNEKNMKKTDSIHQLHSHQHKQTSFPFRTPFIEQDTSSILATPPKTPEIKELKDTHLRCSETTYFFEFTIYSANLKNHLEIMDEKQLLNEITNFFETDEAFKTMQKVKDSRFKNNTIIHLHKDTRLQFVKVETAEQKRELKKLRPKERVSCPDCPKSLNRKSDLKRHISTIHLKCRPFKCEFCSKGYSRGDVLRKHYKKCIVGFTRKKNLILQKNSDSSTENVHEMI